ncbi:hypothetical protein [Cobetia marina]|uniref:hypothetical protein n=1 Tax=Cobetia marina TaxID=28258 RepID=UPI00116E4DE7|nr:hypothetical protein [Cobetia marina]GED41592.1 hypothetical protein HHA02_09210 [Cobetia marina]
MADDIAEQDMPQDASGNLSMAWPPPQAGMTAMEDMTIKVVPIEIPYKEFNFRM